ncbi:MAG: hypothetical protein KJ737_24810 [Proteobacteria bacterium]|nr:hypothetical protein [Pseudomonadota bacterium]
MKMWSRGLGTTELRMDCRYYQVKKSPDSDNVYIIGKITDPVNWEFRVTVEPTDIAGLTKLFFNFSMMKLVFKNLHRYILYLINRQKYIDASGADLEAKVDTAYEQMMNRTRPSRLRA